MVQTTAQIPLFSQRYTFYKDYYLVRLLLSESVREHNQTESLCLLCLFCQMLSKNNACSSTDTVKTDDKGHYAL